MPKIKPSRNIFNPSRLPGCTFLAGFTEGSGSPRVWINGQRQTGTVVGTPNWTPSLYGPSITNLSSTSYIDYPVTYSNGVRWQACLFSNTSTAQSNPYAWASTANDNTFDEVVINFGTTGTVNWFLRDDSGTLAGPSSLTLPCNDGLPHVVMTLIDAAKNYSLAWDGNIVSTRNISSSLTFTPTQLSLGVSHRGTGGVAGSFPGNLIALAFGVGQTPTVWNLYHDWISGNLYSFRKRRKTKVYIYSSTPSTFKPYFLNNKSTIGTGIY